MPLSSLGAYHNSRTNPGPRLHLTVFAVSGGFEGHDSELSVTSACLPARMPSPAMIVYNRCESRLFRARAEPRQRFRARRQR